MTFTSAFSKYFKYFKYFLIIFSISVLTVFMCGCIENPIGQGNLGGFDHDHDHEHNYVHNHDHDHDYNHDHDHDHLHWNDEDVDYVPLDNSSMESVISGDKILVAVSMVPQTEFVEKVGGRRVVAISMVPPGAGHNYDPSPRQLEDLAKAKIYFSLDSGEPFENKHLKTFSETNPNLKIVSTSKGMNLIRSEKSTDPHTWTSPKEVQIAVENIYEGLKSIDPENESYYFKNKESYISELKSLDSYIENALSNKENRTFIVYHPAWGYYARDYNLTQIAIELDGKEPSAKSVKNLVDRAKKENVKVVFVQKQLSQSYAESIAKEIGGTVISVDPLAKNYVENTKYMTDILKENMS